MMIANRKMLWLLGTILLTGYGFSLIGCGSNNSSPSGPPVTSMGQPTEEEVPQQSAGSFDDDAIGKTVTIEGEIVKQCPAVGCWFIVKDETGEVFIDLNPAKLHLEQERVGEQARVTGRVVKQAGQFRLEAVHVQFETKKETAPEHQE